MTAHHGLHPAGLQRHRGHLVGGLDDGEKASVETLDVGRVTSPAHCSTCKHEWGYHGGDGCQAQVQISGDWYDCNCQREV